MDYGAERRGERREGRKEFPTQARLTPTRPTLTTVMCYSVLLESGRVRAQTQASSPPL